MTTASNNNNNNNDYIPTIYPCYQARFQKNNSVNEIRE